MPSDAGGPNAPSGITSEDVTFDYIKSAQWRTYRADGVIGAVTPNRHLHMAFYSERMPIPTRLVYALNKDGSLGEIIDRSDRGAVVREMDFDVVLREDVVRSLHQWLTERLGDFDKLQAADRESAK